MPMTARNVTQSDVAEAAGASGSFPLWLTDDQPTELDKEVPICARPPTRALPRTSWFANMDCSAGVAASRPPAHELVVTSSLLTRQKSRPAGTTAARTRCGRFPATVDRVLAGSGARPINRCPTTAVVGHLAGP